MNGLFENQSPSQAGLDFPVALTERYRPHSIADFVGLSKPKAICAKLASNPFPSAWLFRGESGTGKTTMAMALAELIPAASHYAAETNNRGDQFEPLPIRREGVIA
jgi:replication-associated recombination protein RarA